SLENHDVFHSVFFVSGRRRHTIFSRDWSSDVCSSDLKSEGLKPVAEIFLTSYTLDDADPTQRPVIYAFNGGPGSSSTWLHLGLQIGRASCWVGALYVFDEVLQ